MQEKITFRKYRAAPVAVIVFATVALGVTAMLSVATPAQQLPRLHLVRTLPAPNEHYPFLNLVSGTSNLTWSADGERLAAYARYGGAIMVWSPDGKVRHEIPRYNAATPTSANVLGFVAGHSQLLTGPAAPDPIHLRVPGVEDAAFSILDADTGKVVHNVIGLNPGKSSRENIAWRVAISPNQRLVAVIYNVIFDQSADRRIGIYSTSDWQRIATIPIGKDVQAPKATAVAFSQDGKFLAAAYLDKFGKNKTVDIFDVASWRLLRSIRAFPDAPPKVVEPITAIGFSPDASMIAVMLAAGTEPHTLRVFRIADGGLVAGAGGFINGLITQEIDWSRADNFLEFYDLRNNLYFWNPVSGDPPQKECQLDVTTTAVRLSPDGAMLSQGFEEGVNLYEMLNRH